MKTVDGAGAAKILPDTASTPRVLIDIPKKSRLPL
jgi:hypothetical protein